MANVISKFSPNDTAFLIESNRIIREVKILKFSGGLYTIRFVQGGGGIKVRESRLFATEEEARASIPTTKPKPATNHPALWDLQRRKP